MSFEEFVPNWIYTFLLIPLGVFIQKHFSLSARVDVIEATQNLKKEDITKLQECMSELSNKIEYLNGQFDEHNRKNI